MACLRVGSDRRRTLSAAPGSLAGGNEMTWTDWLWEVIDTGLFAAHIFLIVLLTASAIACPLLLWSIRCDLYIIRDSVQKDVTVIDVRPDSPGPHRVLPMAQHSEISER